MISLNKIIFLASSLLILGCSESATTEAPSDETTEYTDSSYDDSIPVEEEPTYSGNEFNGYPCIGDCSGHEAGYQWAEENSITDEYDCSTPSNSFNEGCQSYVEEQAQGTNQ